MSAMNYTVEGKEAEVRSDAVNNGHVFEDPMISRDEQRIAYYGKKQQFNVRVDASMALMKPAY
jgi:hypothetical protein